ncbi:MAG: PqqD family protein [Theionarchaea archaeon]|nr:PqqD family protein [Theionarchaea archaeon]
MTRFENFIVILKYFRIRRFLVNRTAGDIFLLCDGHNATQDIIDEIMRKYEGDSDYIKDAVITVLKDLIGKGMVQSSSIVFFLPSLQETTAIS